METVPYDWSETIMNLMVFESYKTSGEINDGKENKDNKARDDK